MSYLLRIVTIAALCACATEPVQTREIRALDDGSALVVYLGRPKWPRYWKMQRLDGAGHVVWDSGLPGEPAGVGPDHGILVGREIVAVRYTEGYGDKGLSRLAGLDARTGIERWDTELVDAASSTGRGDGVAHEIGVAYSDGRFVLGADTSNGHELVIIDERSGYVSRRLDAGTIDNAAVELGRTVVFPGNLSAYLLRLQPTVELVDLATEDGSTCVTPEGVTTLGSFPRQHRLRTFPLDGAQPRDVPVSLGELDGHSLFGRRCGTYGNAFVFVVEDSNDSARRTHALVITRHGELVRDIVLDPTPDRGRRIYRSALDESFTGVLPRFVVYEAVGQMPLVVVDLERGAIVARVPVERSGFQVFRVGTRWICAEESGRPIIVDIDGATGRVIAAVRVGDGRRGVGMIDATHVAGGHVWLWDEEWGPGIAIAQLDATTLQPRWNRGLPIEDLTAILQEH